MNFKVSVIIPSYNMEKRIPQCLDSILHQTLSGVEIVIIDDGSTDHTGELLQRYEKSFPNVVAQFQSNQGAGASRNLGIDIARGEYLIFMDADDCYPSPDCLKILYNTAKMHDVDICGGKIALNDRGNRSVFRSEISEIYFKDSFVDVHDYPEIYGHQRYMIKAEFIKKHGIRYARYRRYQDQHFVISSLAKAGGFWSVNKIVYDYHATGNKLSYTYSICRDMLLGIADAFHLVKTYGLWRMYFGSLQNIWHDYFIPFNKFSYCGYREIDNIILDINNTMQTWENGDSPYLPKKKRILKDQENCKSEYMAIRKIFQSKASIIIYGAGKMAELLLDFFSEYLDKVIGFAVTNLQAGQDELRQLPIRSIEEYLPYRENATVLVGTSPAYYNEIIAYLTTLGFRDIQCPRIDSVSFEIGSSLISMEQGM